MNIGDKLSLTNQTAEVVECKNCKKLMVNLDSEDLQPGDLATLKRNRLQISNPNTQNEVCINCEVKGFWDRVNNFLDSDDDDEDDSGFFNSSPSIGGFGGFGGGFSGGGFGGFGGGSFGGGGASRSF